MENPFTRTGINEVERLSKYTCLPKPMERKTSQEQITFAEGFATAGDPQQHGNAPAGVRSALSKSGYQLSAAAKNDFRKRG